MPEVPEISSRAREMHAALVGKTIQTIQILQPKCLNLTPELFCEALENSEIRSVTHHGKWIKVLTTNGWLLINLGMGGEILLTTPNQLPAKYRLLFHFTDGSLLVINFWWFGYAYYGELDKLNSIPMIAKLGPDILGVELEEFSAKLKSMKPKAKLKSFLLDQTNFAGIGNAYIHDILFLAKIHPERPLGSLSDNEVANLHVAIKDGLVPSIEKGGAFYEVNLFGQKGGFQMEDILIGYKENNPCPICGTEIIKIRTGSTNSFLCPQCQPLRD